MCENEQKPELEPEPRIKRAPEPEPHSWKPRALELEPRSWKEELRSRRCVIFTTPRPWTNVLYWIKNLWHCWDFSAPSCQGRNKVWWRPGQEASLAPPCLNLLRSFRSKCTLKKVLVTFLGLFGAPRSDSAPGELCPLSLRPFPRSDLCPENCDLLVTPLVLRHHSRPAAETSADYRHEGPCGSLLSCPSFSSGNPYEMQAFEFAILSTYNRPLILAGYAGLELFLRFINPKWFLTCG